MGQERTKDRSTQRENFQSRFQDCCLHRKDCSWKDEKTALAAQLDEIHKAAKKAKEAAELKRLLKLMHNKDISVEDLESMISKEKLIAKTGSEEFFLPNRFFYNLFIL